MRQSNLLLLNVSATLARMAATFFLGLYTTRIAYRSLGEQGFGAYVACLALVSIIAMVSETFSLAAQRHIAHAIGADDRQELRRISGTFVTIAIGMSAALVIGTGALAGWMAGLIQAPAEQSASVEDAIRWVGCAFGLTILQAPFKAYLIAHQSIVKVSLFELFESAARLAAACWLVTLASPTIADYGRSVFFCLTPHTTALVVLCLLWIPVTRPFLLTGWKPIVSLGSWLTLGTAGWTMRTQVSQLLINSLSGPAASASYSIGLQIAYYQHNVRTAVFRAVRPATVTAEARGVGEHVSQLALSSSKIMGMICLLFAAPVLLDTETLLEVWLGKVGPETAWIVRLSFLWICLKDLTGGYVMAVHARGKVAVHECVRTAIDVTAVAVAAIIVYRGGSALTFPAAVLGVVLAQIVMHVVWYGDAAHATPWEWVRGVLAPFACVAAMTAAAAAPIVTLMAPSPVRLLTLAVTAAFVAGVGIVTIGLSRAERKRLADAFGALRSRARRLVGQT